MPLPSDIEIAERAELRPIAEVGAKLGIADSELEPYGAYKAKLVPRDHKRESRGKLILVTAMTATRKGAGKTVTAVGLGQAFGQLGLSHCLCLRQPSLGPTLGIKGGAAGGGYSQVVPMKDINLHFTGDLHAVTTAHNTLAALVDNHVHFDNELGIDPARIVWPRVIDLCDRQLRRVRIGLGGKTDGFAHDTRFDITAASEVMAVLALAEHRQDLEARLSRMVVGYRADGSAVRAGELAAVGAMSVLLEQALQPNLVQTLEHTPALIHCGPFANIAHGCNSVVATKTALALTDYVITEAGFGADLGAEKFFHIKCRQAGLSPAAAVVVVTCPALRRHGGAADDATERPDLEALTRGLANARVHIENVAKFGVPVVVSLNAFPGDTKDEIAAVRGLCEQLEVGCAVTDAFGGGGAGTLELARLVKVLVDKSANGLQFLYRTEQSLPQKIEALATELYRADGVDYDDNALIDLDRLGALDFADLPICVAKTPLSLSDRASLLGVPKGWRLRVRAADVSAGAGFVVVSTGKVNRMPGMPREPGAHRLHFDEQGHVRGLS